MTRGDTPSTVRLRLPYPDADAFVAHYARHTRGGLLFLPTRRGVGLGERVRFELLDKGSDRLMLGEGRVVREEGPGGRAGMMVKVLRLDGPSKKLWEALVEASPELEGDARVRPPAPEDDGEDTTDSGKTDPIGRAIVSVAPDVEKTEGTGTEPIARSPARAADPGEAGTVAAPPPKAARRKRDVFGLDLPAAIAGFSESDPEDTGPGPDAVKELPWSESDDDATPTTTPVDVPPASPKAPAAEAASETPPGEATPPEPEPSPDDDTPPAREAPPAVKPPPLPTGGRATPGADADGTVVGLFAGADAMPEVEGILGIDLGTSRTRAALAKAGAAEIVPLEDALGLPSVVAPGEFGGLEVGAAALRRRLEQPERTIFGSKRLLGRKFHSPLARAYREILPYELVADESGGVAVPLPDGSIGITEVHARILEAVRLGVTKSLGGCPRRAVISVPAHFGDAQRAAVREAGMLAGLEVVRIVGEPTAAALAYGHGRGIAAKRLVVYDLGGGTFDVSVVTVSGERFEVVATGGDAFLGGVDFDLAVVRRLLEAMVLGGGPESPGPRILERLIVAAEEAKVALSEKETHTVRLPALWQDDEGTDHDLSLDLTRDQLEAWTGDLVARTVVLTREVLVQNGLKPDLVDEVLVVGGQSRMPLVHRRLAELFGKPPQDGVDPATAVAVGSALLAGAIEGESDPESLDVHLRDVLSVTIGLGLPDGTLLPVVEANTPIPCERTLRVATRTDGQDSIEVLVFQGNVDRAEEAEYLGCLAFVGLSQKPAGEVVLRLRFALDAEGLLTVQATDEASGEIVERVLSTADTEDALRERLAEQNAVIHDVAGPAAASSGSGFLSGLKKRLFGGDAE